MVVSIVVFAVVRWPAWYWLVLSRIVLIPLIAGISYEIIKWAGRHETSAVRARRHGARAGAAVDDDEAARRAQIEVAIAALERVIELEPQDGPPVEGVEVMA